MKEPFPTQPIMFSPPPTSVVDNTNQAFHLLAEALYVLKLNSAHLKKMGEKLNMDEFALSGIIDYPDQLGQTIQRFFDRVEGK